MCKVLLNFELTLNSENHIFFRYAITAAALKEAWAAIIIQKHCRGYLVRRLCQLIRVAALTIQAFTRGFLARKRYRKVQIITNVIKVQKCKARSAHGC